MAKRYSAELLRRLRNEIPMDWLICSHFSSVSPVPFHQANAI